MTNEQIQQQIEEILAPFGGAEWSIASTLGTPEYVLSIPGERGWLCRSVLMQKHLEAAINFAENMFNV